MTLAPRRTTKYNAGVEEEESGRGLQHRGVGWSTTRASRRRRAEEDADVEEEESREGRWRQGRQRSTMPAPEEEDRVRCWRPRRRTEKDSGAHGGGWSMTLAMRMKTEYDAGAEEDDRVRLWR